ncbi:MAG: GTPase HflX [Thermodesulfovibrionales bacterium]
MDLSDEGFLIAAVFGNTSGLKGSELSSLQRIYRRRVPARSIATPELVKYISEVSALIGRQVGVLINREGAVTHVIAGDAKGIFIPSLEDHPLGKRALRGLRLIHTHLRNEDLSRDDLTDLALLRLDLIAAVGVGDGDMERVKVAHLVPQGIETMTWNPYREEPDFVEFVRAIEDEMDRRRVFDQSDPRERAILISVSTRPRHEQEDSVEELKELAASNDILVLDAAVQRPKKINPKYLMGEGKLKELIIDALNKGATLLVFDQDLSPSQMKAVAELTELKVIDRSQLILDIFARRAHSRDGKVQVELAQLKYRLPRLAGKGTAMSRLMGGIGGRGPGEMKLEVDRRRVRDRIHLLEKKLKDLSEARRQRKRRRAASGVPIVSIVGYTNAGKSTLLNALTRSSTFVEEKMFATLDTATRRLRFPREREIVITDTVGFIRDLPGDLMAAFRATLEELADADLLLHLVDASNPRFPRHIESVEKILEDLGLGDKERVLVLNKTDRLSREEARNLSARYGAVAVSALDPSTLGPLLEAMEERLWREGAGIAAG